MNALTLLAKYPGLLELQPLAKKRADELSREDLRLIASAFKLRVPFSDELQDAFLSLLKGKNIHEVSDLIQSPESLNDIVSFFSHGYKGLSKSQIDYSEGPDALSLYGG